MQAGQFSAPDSMGVADSLALFVHTICLLVADILATGATWRYRPILTDFTNRESMGHQAIAILCKTVEQYVCDWPAAGEQLPEAAGPS